MSYVRFRKSEPEMGVLVQAIYWWHAFREKLVRMRGKQVRGGGKAVKQRNKDVGSAKSSLRLISRGALEYEKYHILSHLESRGWDCVPLNQPDIGCGFSS